MSDARDPMPKLEIRPDTMKLEELAEFFICVEEAVNAEISDGPVLYQGSSNDPCAVISKRPHLVLYLPCSYGGALREMSALTERTNSHRQTESTPEPSPCTLGRKPAPCRCATLARDVLGKYNPIREI